MRGLGIGAAGGATLGAFAAETNKAQWSALMALGWGTVGAAIGAINGLHRDRVLLYDVQTSNQNDTTRIPNQGMGLAWAEFIITTHIGIHPITWLPDYGAD